VGVCFAFLLPISHSFKRFAAKRTGSNATMTWTKLGGTPKGQASLQTEKHHLTVKNRLPHPYLTSPIEAFESWRPHTVPPRISEGILYDIAVARVAAMSPPAQSSQIHSGILSKWSQLTFLIHLQQLKKPTTPFQGFHVPRDVVNLEVAKEHQRDSPIHATLRSKGGPQKERTCPGPIRRRSGVATKGCFPLPSSRNDRSATPVLKLSNTSRFATKWKELMNCSTSAVEREHKKALLKEYFSRRDIHSKIAACSRHPAKYHPKNSKA
jgi:hypothetical protein